MLHFFLKVLSVLTLPQSSLKVLLQYTDVQAKSRFSEKMIIFEIGICLLREWRDIFLVSFYISTGI